jgi:hypothetical protein
MLLKHSNRMSDYTSPTYNTWRGMKLRCYNKNREDYKHYGGRGIEVCERWRSSFVAFLEDMGPRPPGMTLDRIDVNKGYCKDNCRWATKAEQERNKRVHSKVLPNTSDQRAV